MRASRLAPCTYPSAPAHMSFKTRIIAGGHISLKIWPNVIPNVATDIIPFIFPLHRFASVADYMVHAVRPGQRHFVAEERL